MFDKVYFKSLCQLSPSYLFALVVIEFYPEDRISNKHDPNCNECNLLYYIYIIYLLYLIHILQLETPHIAQTNRKMHIYIGLTNKLKL